MKRLPLLLSIVAVVVGVAALVVAIVLPGPQGPKGDAGRQGMQGVQGIQGPPSSLSVQHMTLSFEIGIQLSISAPYSSPIHLNAGDVLQGYIRGLYTNGDYEVWISGPGLAGPSVRLGRGLGGTVFCYVAEATEDYALKAYFLDWDAFLDANDFPYSEDVAVVYWTQEGTTQA